MQVMREKLVTKRCRPIVAKINHCADVRVAAVHRTRAGFARATGAVAVLSRGEHEVLQSLARTPPTTSATHKRRVVAVHLIPVMPALHDKRSRTAPPVAAAVGDEHVTVVIEIDPPLVATAPRKHLELVPHRMIAPDAGVQANPLAGRRAGLADERLVEHAMIAVKPAVRPPCQAVRRLVRVLITPAVEQRYRIAVRHVIAVAVRNEQQMRRGAKPHATETHLDAADEVQFFGKHRSFFKCAISIGVLKNHHAIAALANWLALRITVGLNHP